VGPGYDDVKNEYFYRPLGGAVEFGELAEEALRREIREELALEIRDPVRIGVLENRFEYRGIPCHEIVFVFDAAFVDEAVYAQPSVEVCESNWGGAAEWLHLAKPFPHQLVPAGLEGLLRQMPKLLRREPDGDT
jgi:8-oxo-dGTP pyrophosphatase MutT (NUDIX family)